jgi:hypothetical protein
MPAAAYLGKVHVFRDDPPATSMSEPGAGWWGREPVLDVAADIVLELPDG